jgi:hypothetical protein
MLSNNFTHAKLQSTGIEEIGSFSAEEEGERGIMKRERERFRSRLARLIFCFLF